MVSIASTQVVKYKTVDLLICLAHFLWLAMLQLQHYTRENITSNGLSTKFVYGFGSFVGHMPKISKLIKNLFATRYCTAQGELKKSMYNKQQKSNIVRQLWPSIMAIS